MPKRKIKRYTKSLIPMLHAILEIGFVERAETAIRTFYATL
jgi:hypothetical protein